MNIIAHRGLWKIEMMKNSYESFKEAFNKGFGVETDIRDSNCELVISHDIPDKNSLIAENFFSLYKERAKNYYLALNIKADGLQEKLLDLLKLYNVENYFCFDMSIPDNFSYMKKNINFFSRQSDFENNPIFYNKAKGVWIDSFEDEEWINENIIKGHVVNNKMVAFVSPELHKRDHLNLWNFIKSFSKEIKEKFFLCTDYPEKAKEYFLYE